MSAEDFQPPHNEDMTASSARHKAFLHPQAPVQPGETTMSQKLRAVELKQVIGDDQEHVTAREEERNNKQWQVIMGVAALLLAGVITWQSFTAYNGKMRLDSGIAALSKGEPDIAVVELSICIKSDPQLRAAYLYRALAYSAQGLTDKAIEDYSRVISFSKKNADAYLGRAVQYLKTREYDKAIADCTEALKYNGKLIDAYRIMAAAEVKSGKYAEAISHCNAYLDASGTAASNADQADAVGTLALAQLKLKQTPLSINNYTRAIKLNESNGYLYAGRARAYKEQGDWNKAIADCDKALQLIPDLNVYRLRSSCYLQGQDYPKALKDINTSIELSPLDLALYKQRGALLLAAGNYPKAVEDFQFVLRRHPGDTQAQSDLDAAHAHMPLSATRLTAIQDAESEAGGVEPKFTGDQKTLVANGMQLLNQGSASQAISVLTVAVKKDPNDPHARRFLAYALFKAGQANGAVTQFNALSRLTVLQPPDLLCFGKALDQAGQPALALAKYEECLKQNPADAEVRLSAISSCSHLKDTARAVKLAREGMANAADEQAKRVFNDQIQKLTTGNTTQDQGGGD